MIPFLDEIAVIALLLIFPTTSFWSDNNKEKQEDSAKELSVELSKNAQFRAICPSPSIISFVEDNLLGRRHDIQLKTAGYNIERCWLIPHESIWSSYLPAFQNLFQARNSSLV